MQEVLAEEKAPLTIAQEFLKLSEKISENLLTEDEEQALLESPRMALIKMVNNVNMAEDLIEQIVRSFFVLKIRMREQSEDVKTVLKKSVLDKITERLSNTDSLDTVQLSTIYNNLK